MELYEKDDFQIFFWKRDLQLGLYKKNTCWLYRYRGCEKDWHQMFSAPTPILELAPKGGFARSILWDGTPELWVNLDHNKIADQELRNQFRHQDRKEKTKMPIMSAMKKCSYDPVNRCYKKNGTYDRIVITGTHARVFAGTYTFRHHSKQPNGIWTEMYAGPRGFSIFYYKNYSLETNTFCEELCLENQHKEILHRYSNPECVRWKKDPNLSEIPICPELELVEHQQSSSTRERRFRICEWVKCIYPSGELSFYNTLTRKSQVPPSAEGDWHPKIPPTKTCSQWIKCADPVTGEMWYHNTLTGATQRENPNVKVAQQWKPVKKAVRFTVPGEDNARPKATIAKPRSPGDTESHDCHSH